MKTIISKSGIPIELNQAFNMDCLEFMKKLPDKCIDLVLTDPPYGINAGDQRQQKSRTKLAKATEYHYTGWDKGIPSKEVFDEMIRVSKNQIIWGGNYFIDYLYSTPSMIVWDKDNTGDFADCEIAWTSHKKAVRKIKHRWNGMLQENMKNKDIRIHPTQKPLRVIKFCLEKYTEKDMIIFDPFLGSFTTAIAADQYKLNWIGCELDEKYYSDGYHRYEQETKQLLMDF